MMKQNSFTIGVQISAAVAAALLSSQVQAQIKKPINFATAVDGRTGLGAVCRDYSSLMRETGADARELADQQEDVQYAVKNGLQYAPELQHNYDRLMLAANQRLALLTTKGRTFDPLSYDSGTDYVVQYVGTGNSFLQQAKSVHTILQKHAGSAFSPKFVYEKFSAGFAARVAGKTFAEFDIPPPVPGRASPIFYFWRTLLGGPAGDAEFEPYLEGTTTIDDLCNPANFNRLGYRIRVNFLGPDWKAIDFVADPSKSFEGHDSFFVLLYGGWFEDPEAEPEIYNETWSAIRRLMIELMSEVPDYEAPEALTRKFIKTESIPKYDEMAARIRQHLGELGYPLRHNIVRRLSPQSSGLVIGTWIGSSGICNQDPALCEEAQRSSKALKRLAAIQSAPLPEIKRSLGRFEATDINAGTPYPVPLGLCDPGNGLFAKFSLPNGPEIKVFFRDMTDGYEVCSFKVRGSEFVAVQ